MNNIKLNNQVHFLNGEIVFAQNQISNKIDVQANERKIYDMQLQITGIKKAIRNN